MFQKSRTLELKENEMNLSCVLAVYIRFETFAIKAGTQYGSSVWEARNAIERFSIAASLNASKAACADLVIPTGFNGTLIAAESWPCTEIEFKCSIKIHNFTWKHKITLHLPTILNGCISLSLFCSATAWMCNLAKIGLGSTRKSRRYEIDVPAMFGNFSANLPSP